MKFHEVDYESRVYNYGALAPIEGLDNVLEQLFQAHRFRNDLVRVERDRREQIVAERDRLFPDYAALKAKVEEQRGVVQKLEQDKKAQNQQARTKVRDKDLILRIKLARAELKTLNQQEKAMRKEINQDLELQAAWDVVHERQKEARKAKYNEYGMVCWGTRCQVTRQVPVSVTGSLPQFRRYQGEGRIAVQIQQSNPLTVEALTLGTDSRLRLEPVDFSKKKRQRKSVVWLRIGSSGVGNRNPVWAKVPVLMHRPLPAGKQVKWAWLLRRRIGTIYRWWIQFTLADKDWPLKGSEEQGRVGVNFGWRKHENGLRVAYWYHSAEDHGEFVIPESVCEDVQRVEQIQSDRDTNFDSIRDRLVAWLSATVLPDWLKEKTECLARWRSQNRLRSVVRFWDSNRFSGDEEIYNQLAAWQTEEKKRYTQQAFVRRNIELWRRSFYIDCANGLAKRFGTVCLADTDWSRMRSAPAKQEDPEFIPVDWRNLASPGFFARTKATAFRNVAWKDSKHITDRCHVCKELCEGVGPELVYECEHCHSTWDIDYNAAVNLLNNAAVSERKGVEQEPGQLSQAASAE